MGTLALQGSVLVRPIPERDRHVGGSVARASCGTVLIQPPDEKQ